MRPLVVAAHGTVSEAGRAVIEDCARRAADLVGAPWRVGYVDVCAPALADVLSEADDSVVVPLFLTSGYHVRYDVPAAVARARSAVVTPALGAGRAVVEALGARVREALGAPGHVGDHIDALVLASAGSSLASARAEVDEVAAMLAETERVPVSTAYLSGPGTDLTAACAAHREAGRSRLAVATHLLAPGVFLDRARRVAADCDVLGVGAELGTHPAVSTLVAARYTAARLTQAATRT
ncbi:sirohydrochlorin chelatase [Nostocoides sp. F2B08]|uniref:sirohydrochlorin chelatase n=1 Tax=Nostocoides sp. F2B08 TaxID=2653936 RepID=UPI00186AE4A0|nr:CbiX/SirB N-terminal domain-containing protein [Tetrasphaera sp. F2B08]